MEIIDYGEGLELWRDDGGYVVCFADEHEKGGGSSLLFTYHEQQVYGTETGTEEDLDNGQVRQVKEWFEEYEA